MTHMKGGPPKEFGAPKGPNGSSGHHTTPTTTQHTRFDDLAARARRRGAAIRSTPISTCGCIQDPDVDRHNCDRGITDKQVDAAVAAAVHLESLRTPGLFDTRMCHAMWRAGYRGIATRCFRHSSGEAA